MSVVQILYLIFYNTMIYAAGLILTALGGTFSERGGVVNIGLEGIMVMGAFSSAVFNIFMAQSLGVYTPWVGMLIGGLVGVLFALIHAISTINLRADHIISGTVINLAAPALAIFLTRAIFGAAQTSRLARPFRPVTFPVLGDIPIIGDIFFSGTSAPAYFGIAVSILCWFIMYKTRFGLRLRSVGEHPQAAETLGVSVYGMKYAAVLISGFLGGMGGAIQSQAVAQQFDYATISGQGFMAMAAMIFGKWNPLGAMGAAIFFGFAQALSVVAVYIPFLNDNVPEIYLTIAPYVLTIIILVAVIGRSSAPKALGKTYIKSK